jgi:uncharacterized membrane protein
MKQKWQLIIFCLIHAVILLIVFTIVYDTAGDAVYFGYAEMIAQGQLPYRDFAVEYPPLALVFLALPRLIASGITMYIYLFAAQILLFDLLGLFLISSLSRRLGLNLVATLAIYTLAVLAIGPLFITRYDLIPAIMVLLSIYAFSRSKYKLSWAILAIGMMTKIYPAVIAPVFLLYHFRHRQYRHIITGVGAFAITTAIIMVPCLLLSADSFWQSFSYHAQRGLQSESTYASFLLVGHTLGINTVGLEFGFGSNNIASPLADTLAKFSPLVMLLSLALVYWFFYKSYDKTAAAEGMPTAISQPDMINITNYSLLAILAFMVTSKVLSPQFIIWLYPLVPLVAGRWRKASWLIFIIIGLMTYYIFPLNYDEFLQLETKVIDILFWRNILLIAMAGLLLGERRTGGNSVIGT